MNIAQLINFNSCDRVAYSETRLKAITTSIAATLPQLQMQKRPFVSLSAVWAKAKEKTTCGLMCQVLFFSLCVCVSVCVLFVFIAVVLITFCRASNQLR